MNEWLAWLEGTALSVWVREDISVFAFPGVLSLHTIGMGFVAGINAMLALRILGVARGVPLIELKRFFKVMWIGFWLNAASGVVLLIGYPTKALTNPVFYIKLTLVALAIITFKRIEKRMFENTGAPVSGKSLALASLFFWGGAITTGRFLAYTYSKLTQAG
jgi:hypothetical protein